MGLRIGGITFQGLSSGFPTQEIIEKILALERQPIEHLETRKVGAEEKRGLLDDLNSKTRALRDLLRRLDNMNTIGTDLSATEEFKRYQATSSDSSLATATAGNRVAAGTLSLGVEQLALQERNFSNGFAGANDSIGNGSFQFHVGSGSVTTISIDSSNQGLGDFARAINDANAGISATVVYDGGASATPYRLMISGTSTGSDHSITFDSLPSGLTITESQAAQNARIILDRGSPGAVVAESSTNTFDSVAQDLTIEVKKVDLANDVTITLERDTEQIKGDIKDIVDAYNEVISLIEDQAKIDPATNRGGPLIGDRTLLNLKHALSMAISRTVGSGTIRNASQIGMEIGRDGRLQLDETKLQAALDSGFEAVAGFFASRDSNITSFAVNLRSVTDRFVDAVDGALVARIEGANETIADIAQSIEEAEARLERTEESLILRFTALERAISQMRQQGDFLSQSLQASLGR